MTRGPRQLVRELGLAVGSMVLVAVALVYPSGDWHLCLQRSCLTAIGGFVVTMAIGERARVRPPGRRPIAPLATAAALAFAVTQPLVSDRGAAGRSASQPAYGWQVVVVFTALAMLLGVVPDLLQHRAVDLSDLAPRLIGVCVVAVLYRALPLLPAGPGSRGHHEPSVQFVQREAMQQDAWKAAILMVAAAAAGLLVELLISAFIDSARAHAPYFRTLTDTARALGGLGAALVATGALIALAYKPLGLFAIPLMLLPLAVTQVGVRRFAGSRETYRQTIVSLSRLTDSSGYTAAGHSERVAVLAVSMGRDLGMSDREVTELEYAALLHDIGQVGLVDPIPRGATIMAAPSDQLRIAKDGAHIVRETGVLDQVATILERQATPYRQTFEFGDDIPLASRIIKVSNAFDDLAEGARGPVLRATALERIHLGLGYEYDPKVVDALGRVLERKTA